MSTNNIDPKVLANMNTHYSSLLKAGATGLGNDAMSKSIFAAIDKDGSGEISQAEIDTATPSLSEILKKAAQKTMAFATVMFGKKTEEICMDDHISRAYEKLVKYAKEHPEDTKLQEYAKKAEELMKEGKITSAAIDDNLSKNYKTNGEYFGKDNLIKINYNNSGDLNEVLNILIHELGHAIDGDTLDSLAEEKEVEDYARTLTSKITGEPPDMTNSLQDFIEPYKNKGYPQNSPGHNGIPKNAGIEINFPIGSVERDGNTYFIKSKPNEIGRYIETVIEYGINTDSSGNLLPICAKESIHSEDGSIIGSKKYVNYNEQEKRFVDANEL